jgi:hypothetical protein
MWVTSKVQLHHFFVRRAAGLQQLQRLPWPTEIYTQGSPTGMTTLPKSFHVGGITTKVAKA